MLKGERIAYIELFYWHFMCVCVWFLKNFCTRLNNIEYSYLIFVHVYIISRIPI